jgi:hypothetical protein
MSASATNVGHKRFFVKGLDRSTPGNYIGVVCDDNVIGDGSGLVLKEKPRYAWIHPDHIDDTVRFLKVKALLPRADCDNWYELVYEEEP